MCPLMCLINDWFCQLQLSGSIVVPCFFICKCCRVCQKYYFLNILCSTTNELVVKENMDLEGGIFMICSLSLSRKLQAQFSFLQPLRPDQERQSNTAATCPPVSSHCKALNSPHTAPESSGGNRAGPVRSTLPLIILILRGLKRSGERGGVEVRASDRSASAGVPFPLQLQRKPLPQ